MFDNYVAYIAQMDKYRVVIRADGTGSRQQRASQVSALKRAVEKMNGYKLERTSINYSEGHGFLSRTEVWYRVIRPGQTWEVWEFSSDHQFSARHGVVSIRGGYASERDARDDMSQLCTRENERRAAFKAQHGYADPFPRTYSVRPVSLNRRKTWKR
jgi:hypothetical protein